MDVDLAWLFGELCTVAFCRPTLSLPNAPRVRLCHELWNVMATISRSRLTRMKPNGFHCSEVSPGRIDYESHPCLCLCLGLGSGRTGCCGGQLCLVNTVVRRARDSLMVTLTEYLDSADRCFLLIGSDLTLILSRLQRVEGLDEMDDGWQMTWWSLFIAGRVSGEQAWFDGEEDMMKDLIFRWWTWWTWWTDEQMCFFHPLSMI